MHARPEIDLINPSLNINNGNITVASNWNLGAGSVDASGHVSLVYRTATGGEPDRWFCRRRTTSTSTRR